MKYYALTNKLCLSYLEAYKPRQKLVMVRFVKNNWQMKAIK